MKIQTTFKRYELKYILESWQKDIVLDEMKKYMKLDNFGRTTIRNIYFDTDDYRLIRHSIEKPKYKEKLRIRSYKQVNEYENVFVELKKKYDGIVYKRRVVLPEKDVMNAFYINKPLPINSQIGNEIQYFREYYKNLKPKVFLHYDREAYFSLDGSDFRITFDENIQSRKYDISLQSELGGEYILDKNKTLMEVKTSEAIPLWLVRIFSELNLYKTSYSKYGAAYKTDIYKLAGGF